MDNLDFEYVENSLEYRRRRWITKIQHIWEVDYNTKFEARTGEIYEVEFGENVGDEFSGRHLALVLQNSSASNSKVLVIPITSRFEEYNSKYTIKVKSYVDDKLIEGGLVLGEAKWISKQRINRYSAILKEDPNDKNKCVGFYYCDKSLLKKLACLGGC